MFLNIRMSLFYNKNQGKVEIKIKQEEDFIKQLNENSLQQGKVNIQIYKDRESINNKVKSESFLKRMRIDQNIFRTRSKLTIILLIAILCLIEPSNGSSCSYHIQQDGYCDGWSTCYEDNNGNYYGCGWNNVTPYYDAYWQYWMCYWWYCCGGGCYDQKYVQVLVRRSCHGNCASCYNMYWYTCYTCNAPYYKMVQYNYCLTYCPTGDYLTSGGYYGQYIVSSTNRYCGACDSNCRFCLSQNYNCYMCRDMAFLIDNRADCTARFPAGNTAAVASKTNCRKCSYIQNNWGGEACQGRDKICRNTNCPAYFYFQTYRTWDPNSADLYTKHLSNRNPLYQDYVNATSITGAGNGLPSEYYVYRYQTNLCILCSKECTQCDGPTNLNCTSCRNGYFKWTTQKICSQSCPIGEYQDHFNPNPQLHDTECKACDYRCVQCDQKPTNCSICQGSEPTFTNWNVGYLYVYNNSQSTCMTTCPVSPNTNTTKGWYGSIKTMTCYQCPGGCADCNIDITRNDGNIWCTDKYCSEGISCTSCLLGYALVSGKCVDGKSCQRYAYYLPGNVSTLWTPDKCVCHRGYYMNAYVSCNVLCDISCKTCTGSAWNNCASCQQGYSPSSGGCTPTQTLRAHYFPTGTGSGQFWLSHWVGGYCGPHYLYFGYRQFQTGKYVGYQSDYLPNRNYYGFSVKMRVMFIDKWPSTGAIKIHHNDLNAQPVWTWTYDTYGAYGEEGCGTNELDYLMTLYAEYKYQPTTDYVTLYISSNADLFSPYPNWGVKDLVVTVLACHSACATCNGPLATDCLTCSDTTRRVVNKTCTCNTASNWYEQSGSCTNTCNSGYYKDTITAKCVVPTSCTAPKRFADPSTGFCVQDCPATYYAQNSNKICTTDCGAYGEFKYNGAASRSCEDTCPTNFAAYAPATPTSAWECKAKCPAGWYLKLENRLTNPTCADTCPTGWQDEDLAQCVNTCPNGYYKQTYLSQNRCMRVCYAAFGLNSTGACVTACPFPLFGDPTTQLCKQQCPDPYFFQISIVGANRTCTLTCENNQYGNPYYKSCEKDPLKCPVGYFADTHTHLCEQTCTVLGEVGENTTRMCQTTCTTGFADWTRRICVSICPSNPPMFSYVSGATRICVSSCNASSTGLFGDAQANRSCVAKCSSSPTPTFGQVSTSLCVDKCSVATEFGDPLHPTRRCVSTCTASPQTFSYSVTKLCLTTCPDQYYGDNYTVASKGVCSTGCPSGYYGDPISHLCVATCPSGYFGSPLTGRPCVQKCPELYFGQNKTGNRVCVQTCDSGYWADNMTRMCTNVKTECSNDTYADAAKGLCVTGKNCTSGKYADPFTKGCQSACSNSSWFGDPFTNLCVTLCTQKNDQYSELGYCKTACTGNRFADFQDSRKCNTACSRTPIALYGNKNTWRCVIPANCPASHFADNLTLTCVNPCTGTLPFGDPISRQCVSDCPDNYYGDWALNLCVQNCSNATIRYADNITGNCEPICTAPTWGTNSSQSPRCENQCPSGSYAKEGIRICVLDCGSGFYGDPITRKCYSDPKLCSQGYFANSVSNLCVLPVNCQTVSTKHYFAQNSTKTCVSKCDSPNYGDSYLWTCIAVCNNTHYGQNTTRQCLSGCSTYLSFAQSQNHLCVSRCSADPIGHFAQNVTYTCVEPRNCPTDRYAQNNTRVCVKYCPKTPTMTFADVYVTKRCVVTCPDTYYADDSILQGGQCVINCAGVYRFRQNSTKSCVSTCPSTQGTFGDTVGDMCVKTCPDGYFAQQDVDRRCVPVCAANSWGNKVTKVCIKNPVTECPPNTWADDQTHLCEEVCSSTPQSTYGYNVTRKCVTSCTSPTYAFDGTRVCIDICPPSLVNSGYFGDPDMLPTRKCVLTCQTPNLYRDIAANRQCKTSCTFNTTYKTYKDPTTMSCQAFCSDFPAMRYADDLSQTCELACNNGGLKRNDKTRSCVATCPVLYEPNSNLCVEKCPKNSVLNVPLYADLTLKKCIQAANCPASTYASDDSMQCVSTCPINTYIYGTRCVYFCPDSMFMDNVNKKCVLTQNCPASHYAQTLTRTCVQKCTGNFIDKTAKKCVDVCPASTYADPLTGACQSTCSTGFVINVGNNSCVADCAVGLYKNPKNNSCSNTCIDPQYADDTTRSCVQTCTANPLTFASTSNGRKCVSTCLVTQWHDMSARKCVTTCPTNTFAYEFNRSCLLFCPGPNYYALGSSCVTNCSVQSKYSDDTTRTCVGTCPTGYFKDDSTFKCVSNCPQTYYKSSSLGKCVNSCPQGTYSDQQQGQCVTSCSTSPPMFAQQTYNQCVLQCPLALGSFADFTTYKCVTQCPGGYFADNRTRECKQNCSTWYADGNKVPKACTTLCQLGTFADETTYTCVTKCPKNYYGYDTNRNCVQFCPFGLFADNSTSKCVVKCPATWPYADSLNHMCVATCTKGQFGFLATGTNQWGTCVAVCPAGYFSNPLTGKCVTQCPSGYFSETKNNTCKQTCAPDKYRDSINRACVSKCPVANSLFGNRFTKQCVLTCDSALDIYADSLTQFCQQTCTGDQYKTKDSNGKNVCVGKNACPSGLFSDPYMKACVSQCYNNTYGYNGVCYPTCPTTILFANPQTKTCVAATDCPDNFFADSDKKKCVEFCDIATATFGDKDNKKCTKTCDSPYYADNSTRMCVLKCPDIPELFARETDRVCVEKCPVGRFADELSNKCEVGCPDGYFADESTWKCVKKCPEGKFADNSTNYCVTTCPKIKNYFGNPHAQSRQCVLNCPQGTFSDPNNNRQCRPYCIPPLFSENLTNSCQASCKTGFANERTNQCIQTCTTGYYGFDRVCYKYQCPSATPTVFADDTTSLCVPKCPQTSYGDISTRKCVKICPITENTFADEENNLCVNPCPPGTFADSSTRKCVATCPEVPQLFASPNQKACLSNCTYDLYADNKTRSCVAVTQCPEGTFADNSTMKCVATCPSKPMMYGNDVINKCVINCPVDFDLYAENKTRMCQPGCPEDDNTFADPEKRACVATCSLTYFAVNSTRRCSKTCPDGQFADTLLRKCVSKCSVNPVFYGNRLSKQCIPQCPSDSYGNPLTQQCVFDSNGISTCPDGYFADDTTRLCVKKCPMKENLYGDPLTKKCQSACSDPTYYKDNSTMLCVTKCPSYPSYFADLVLKTCVAYCPAFTWADDVSRVCVTQCPVDSYAEDSTWRCVKECMKNPLTFADATTWKCVQKCPTGYFADRSTFKCVSKCPETDDTFAQNTTQTCIKNCPPNTFAENTTRICVSSCWNQDLADNSSNRCVKTCPKYPAYYAYFDGNICVSQCPLTFFSYETDRTCVKKCPTQNLYRQNDTRKCVASCNYTLNEYADNLTGFCVLRCSVDTWSDPTTKTCVSKCPDQPLLYADNTTQQCVTVCPAPFYGQNSTRSCVDKCPTNSLSLQVKHLCVRYCPSGYFAYTQTAFCVDMCPVPYYGDPSTRTCVLACPIIQLLYADNTTRQCVKTCPANSYADKKSKFCVKQCPIAQGQQAQTYAADYNTMCVEQCALPTFAYLPTLKCYNKCPDPYYNNVTDHKCYKCPTVCTTCTSPTGCLGCVPNYYLQNGQCVIQCSGQYYANITTMKCVTSTLCKPYFGVNSTNKCSQSCPQGQWKNQQQWRCDACPKTCVTCSSLTQCSQCKDNAIFANNYCYGYCNDTIQRYYSKDNKTCLASCNDGTYLSVLFCKACDPICTTCVGTATNCTLCSGGLYLQDVSCVAECSQRYKPTTARMCLYCGDNCTEGLNFNTNITQIDGQQNVFMNFNSDVNILGNLYDVFQVQTTQRRLLTQDGIRLLQATTPPPYKIQIMNGKTIRIIFPPGYTADDYKIKIVNPEKIQDEFGNIPSKTRSQVTVDTSELYNTANVPSTFSTYFKVLAIVCIVSFMFDTQLLKFLQLLYIHYFVVMALPPQLSKVLMALRYSTIDYIPSIYTLQQAVLKFTVPGKVYDAIGDYSFLRTAASSVTVLIVMILIFLILKALSLPQINRSKSVRLWVKQLITQKWTFGVWVEMLLIMYVNTFFMVTLQMRDYTLYDDFSTASIVMAHILGAFCIIAIGLLIYKVIKFFNEYPNLSENLKKATDIIMQDEDFKLLNSSNIFMFEKKKIDLRNLMYPKVNNENILPFRCTYRFNFFALFSPIVTLLRLTLLSFIIALAPNTVLQMSLAIPLNILALFYFSKARPYSFKQRKYRIKNYLAIFNQAALIIFQILFMILGLYQKNGATSAVKENFSYYIIYYMTAVTVPNVIYFVFRTVVHMYRKVWIPFTESELFRKNFPEKWAKMQAEKNKEKKITKGIDPMAKEAIKRLLKGFKENFSLRPTQKDKQNPQLPVKHKITYFDRDSSSIASSNTSMTRKQKKNMLRQLFSANQSQDKQLKQTYQQMPQTQQPKQPQQVQYEEYEEQFQVRVKDLAKYVTNAQEILKLLRNRDESDME